VFRRDPASTSRSAGRWIRDALARFSRSREERRLPRIGEDGQTDESGLMLIPLYQALGDDGFFVARVVAFWLGVSRVMRKSGAAGSSPSAVSGARSTIRTSVRKHEDSPVLPLQLFPCSVSGRCDGRTG
jgi:hypothetical protein